PRGTDIILTLLIAAPERQRKATKELTIFPRVRRTPTEASGCSWRPLLPERYKATRPQKAARRWPSRESPNASGSRGDRTTEPRQAKAMAEARRPVPRRNHCACTPGEARR